MTARSGAMHVARNRRTYVAKSGEQRVYESVLVRRTYREGGKVRHETLANLSALPAEAVAAIEATLKGERLVPAGQAVTITASLPHGHVAAVHAMAAKLGLPALLGPACAQRDLALGLVISRVVAPASKLATRTWWADTTLGADPGNTGDPAAFTEIVRVVRDKFGLAEMVMVGDRGMITSARIAALNQQDDGTPRRDPYGWITALRAPAIRKLLAQDGPLQLSLSG